MADYTYADSLPLISMIRKPDKDRERPSEEELKRQEEGVRDVVQYCQNNADCRRKQLLKYFDEDFDARDCHSSCDNCVQDGVLATENVTKAAVDAVKLVQSLQNEKDRVTKNYCLDVFRGANLREIRVRKHDKHPLYGAGRQMPRDTLDRLFEHLLAADAFRLRSIENKSGWYNNYIEVTACSLPV